MVTMTERTTAVAIPAVDALAVAIQREHVAASTAARAALDHALEAGRLLAEARPGIPHGGWEAFVRDRCGLAPRTARLYLQLDANRARIADRQRVAGLTVREAARLVAEPRPEAEEQLEQGARREVRQLTLEAAARLSPAQERRREQGAKQRKSAHLKQKIVSLMIDVRRYVEKLEENTSKQSNRRKAIAEELRRLANQLSPTPRACGDDIEPDQALDEISYYALAFLDAAPERANELEGLLLTWVSRCKQR